MHALVCWCAANKYSELTDFFSKISNRRVNKRVNKTKSTGENASNRDHLGTEGNHESSNAEKSLFWVFLQICDPRFNP